MFSIPQPPPTESLQLPIVDVNEPPEALQTFLQIIYPTPNPPINDIETWMPVYRLPDKYDAGVVLNVHKEYILSSYFDSPPIHRYAVLCICGREKEAEAAARRVPFASLASLRSHPLLLLMAFEHYRRLVEFMVARDKIMRDVLSQQRERIEKSVNFSPPCTSTPNTHRLYALAPQSPPFRLHSRQTPVFKSLKRLV